MKPMGPCLRLSALGCMALALGGCLDNRYDAHAFSPVRSDRHTLLETLKQIDCRREPVTSVAARMKVAVWDAPRGKEFGLDGSYLGDREGRFRIRLTYREHLIMDLAVRRDHVDLWLPRKNRFLRGSRTDLEAGENSELQLIANVGDAHELFFPRAWADAARERRLQWNGNREVVHVLGRPGVRLRTVRRMALAAGSPVPDWVEVFGQGGKSLGKVLYEDFRFPPPRAGSQADIAPVYPGRLTLLTHDNQRTLRFEVEEFIANVPILPEKFEIQLESAQAVSSLGEALKRRESLWE